MPSVIPSLLSKPFNFWNYSPDIIEVNGACKTISCEKISANKENRKLCFIFQDKNDTFGAEFLYRTVDGRAESRQQYSKVFSIKYILMQKKY